MDELFNYRLDALNYKERFIRFMVASSMVLYNKYGMDIHYSTDNTVEKQLDSSDRMILIKDTLTSGNTLISSLKRLQDNPMLAGDEPFAFLRGCLPS